MADSEKPKTEGRPESPTTARELDFDDDEPASHPQTPAKDVSQAAAAGASSGQTKGDESSSTPSAAAGTKNNGNNESGANDKTTTTATTTNTSSAPAQQQAAPKAMSAREQAELTLHEAFPDIDPSVVKAVLAASGGQVEPAFNALLGMSDPSAAAADNSEAAPPGREAAGGALPPPPPPPPQPPRPQVGGGAPGAPQNQLEADELYARQLAEHYQRQDARAMAREQGGYARQGPGRRQHPPDHYEEEERERNFIDDDLPEIGENIRKGFLETQQKFNGWLSTLKKKMDGEDEDEPPQLPARRGQQSSGRRSNDYDRYDADPEEFGSDFSKLQLRDETAQPKQPARRANPDLFKPTPAAPQEGRRVSFQNGPPEEIGSPPDSTKQKSKWQPLSAVDPSPVGEHDPFSLGDSDEEDSKKKDAGDSKDTKDAKNSKDSKSDQSDLLKAATAEAMAGEIGEDSGQKLELKDNTESDSKGK